MSKQYKLVVFDWEGTIGDPLGKLVATLKTTSEELKIQEFDEDIVREYIVLGLPVAVKKLYPDLSFEMQTKLLEEVQNRSLQKTPEAYLMPKAKETIEIIHNAGILLAIASNKSLHSLKRVLADTNLDNYISSSRSSSECKAKPCPDMLEEIMLSCGVGSKDTLMVGDQESDIAMASSIGVDAVGVNFYNQNDNESELHTAGALFVFKNFAELLHFLNLR